MLELRDLTKIYNAGTVTEMTLFDHFNLTVDDGQFVSIVGSNGSGKTSLLNILCGSIPLDGGDVLVGGKSIRKQKDFQRYATIGRVYQTPSLGTCPNLTMLENMSLADNKGKRFGLGFGVNRKRIDFYRSELASLGLGLEDKLDVKMGALSGGQRQAVALLMATMTPLNFLILDEHTAALVLTNMVAADFAAVHVDCNCTLVAGFTLSDNSSLCIPCDLSAIHVERTATGLADLYFNAIQRTTIETERVAIRYCYTAIGFTGIRFQLPTHTTVRQLRGAR